MWIYIVSFFVTTILAYVDQKQKKKFCVKINGKNRYFMSLFGWLAVLIPSIIAGARDYTVGSDTGGYGIVVFNYALNNSFTEFYSSNNIMVKNVEPLYRILVYCIAKIFGSVFWQFFIFEFIICFLVYRALEDQQTKYAWAGYYIFLTYIYSFTLNLMRQSIAIAILLYGFKYVKKKQLAKFLIVVVLASFFQMAAVVGLCIYPLYYICTGKVQTKIKMINNLFNDHRIFMNILIIVASGIVVVLAPKLISLFSVIKGSYGYQLVHMNKTFNPSWTTLFLMILTVLPFILRYKRGVGNDGEFNFFTMILIMSTILWQITGVSQESYRVTLALWILLILAIPKVIEISKNKWITIVYYLLLGGGYFGILFIYDLVNQIYPYTSKILGV